MRRGSCAYFGGGGPKLECYGSVVNPSNYADICKRMIVNSLKLNKYFNPEMKLLLKRRKDFSFVKSFPARSANQITLNNGQLQIYVEQKIMATMQPAATVQRDTNKVIEVVEGGDEDKNDVWIAFF